MPQKLRIIVRVAGLLLVVWAAIHFMVDVAGRLQTDEHATPEGGYVIQRRIEIHRTTFAVGLAGAVLFATSLIRIQKTT